MSTLADALRAIRHHALGIVVSVDGLLKIVEPARPEPITDPAAPCVHPPERRTEAARMGAPGAWVCACGVEGGA